MTDPDKTAKTFWINSAQYPNYGTTKQRRLHELNYLVPKLQGDTLVDLGCGNGALLNCLINLTEFENFYGFDISAKLMSNLHPCIKSQIIDFYDLGPNDLPDSDVVIMAGVMAYIFDDDVADDVLANLHTKRVFVRVPCTLAPTRELINAWSEDLRAHYASVYRTLDEITHLIARHFDVVSVDRVYPDEIESRYGTKQYYVEGIAK